MTRKLVPILLVLAVSAWALPAAQAGHGGKWGHKGHGDHGGIEGKVYSKAHFLLEHADEVGLSEEQQTDIRNLKIELKKSMIRQEAEIDVAKLDIKRLLHDNPIDLETVNGLIDQKYELKKAKAKTAADALARLKATLSAEQYAKMKDLFKAKD